MAKKRGITKSVYIKAENIKICDEISKIAEKTDSSFSDIINGALEQVFYQTKTNVWISPKAYKAIADGKLYELECVRPRNGGTELVIKTDNKQGD